MTQLEKDLLNSAFFQSVKNGRMEDVKKYLADGAAINAEDSKGNNALILAIINDDQEMAAFLIASGINKDHQNHEGDTALLVAIYWRRMDVVQMLLEAGANPDIRGGNGYAPMYHAVQDLSLLDSLLKASANINIRDSDGRTPLMRAAELGKEEALNALLKAGADMTLRDLQGNNVLLRFVVSHSFWPPEHDRVLRILVEAGADIYDEDNKGLTVADHAAARGLKDVEKYLKEYAMEKELSVFKKGLSHPIKATRPFRFKP